MRRHNLWVMNEINDFDYAGVVAADRRENRRSTVVVAIGVLVIVAASATLMAGAPHSPELAAPVPQPTSSGVGQQLPTAPFLGDDGPGSEDSGQLEP